MKTEITQAQEYIFVTFVSGTEWKKQFIFAEAQFAELFFYISVGNEVRYLRQFNVPPNTFYLIKESANKTEILFTKKYE